MSILKELLDLQPLPFKWIDDIRCIFEFENDTYGIFIGEMEIDLPTRTIDLCNISFGRIKSDNFNETSLDTTLSNANKPRTILSTVSSALCSNKKLYTYDIVALASSDQVKEKRFMVYSLALQEIKKKNAKLSNYDLKRIQINDSKIVLLTKLKLSTEEDDYLVKELKLNKL